VLRSILDDEIPRLLYIDDEDKDDIPMTSNVDPASRILGRFNGLFFALDAAIVPDLHDSGLGWPKTASVIGKYHFIWRKTAPFLVRCASLRGRPMSRSYVGASLQCAGQLAVLHSDPGQPLSIR